MNHKPTTVGERLEKVVWEALKGDHNDLRRQRIILNAVKAFLGEEVERARAEERERILAVLDVHIEEARRQYQSAVNDQSAPYRHQYERLLEVRTLINNPPREV